MIYATLIAVGDYKDIGAADIPTYKNDLDRMRWALHDGLRIPNENIRSIAGIDDRGKVSRRALAHAIADVKGQLSEEDVFMLYFSGHGQRASAPVAPDSSAAEATPVTPSNQAAESNSAISAGIVFSDGMIMLQSVIDYVSRLAAGSKIVILDCCYAGDFDGKGPRKLGIEQAFSEFAGKGIAVMASTSADEIARLWPEKKCSVFTGALSQAIMELTAPAAGSQTPSLLTAGIRSREKVSLNDIYDVMMRIITIRNYHDPARQQYPVFRSSIGGTIYFPISYFRTSEEAQRSAKIQQNFTGNIHHVKSLDTQNQKKLAVFVVLPLDTENTSEAVCPQVGTNCLRGRLLAQVWTNDPRGRLLTATRDIVGRIRAEGMEEDVVWCYFGADEKDILNSLHYAYTVWARTDELRSRYYKPIAAAEVCGGIYVCRNMSYDLLKRMQAPTKTREEFIRDVQKLLALIVSNAESFVYDLQEVKNRTRTMEEMQVLYSPWIGRVKSLYIKLSDEDIAPNDLHDWAEAVYDLAGWAADLAILFEAACAGKEERTLIDHTIRRYHEAIERVRQVEP